MKKTLKAQLTTAIAMMVIAVVALSSATYAWFSITANPSVGQINVEVKAADGLLLSELDVEKTDAPDYPAAWKTNITPDMINASATQPMVGKLLTAKISDVSTVAATLKAGTIFDAKLDDNGMPNEYINLGAMPAYNASALVKDAYDYQYVKFTIWFQGAAGRTVSLKGPADTSAAIDDISDIGLTESYVVGLSYDSTGQAYSPLVDSANAKSYIASTVRVGFVPYDGKDTTVIWEPNSGIHVAATMRNENEAAGYVVGQAKLDGALAVATAGDASGAGTLATYANQGSVDFVDEFAMYDSDLIDLFTLDSNGYMKCDIYIWVEGADTDTINAVANSYFGTYLKFELAPETP